MKLVFSVVVRDLRLHLREGSEVINPLVFFAVVVSLFPLGIGPEPEELVEVAPAVMDSGAASDVTAHGFDV